jgi:predicted enzyme related to lactoylglutathione lyase
MNDPFKQHGTFSWCELMTTDAAAAKDFYTRLFGWETEDMSMPGMTYTVVKAGGSGIGGIMAIPENAKGMPPAWGAYVTVDDVDASAKIAEKLGAKICVPPTDIPDVGRFCVIQDPQGATLNMITYKAM